MYLDIDRLINASDQIARRDGRVAPLVVLPYTGIVPTNAFTPCQGFGPLALSYANGVLQQLNQAVEKAVGMAQDRGARSIHFAGPVANSVRGHTICDSDPYVNSVSLGAAAGTYIGDAWADWFGDNSTHVQEFMHPNSKGYLAITNTLFNWQPDTLDAPGTIISGPDDLPREATPVDRNPTKVTFAAASGGSTTVALRRGEAVETTVSGMAPGSHVALTLNSYRRVIGYAEVGQDGTASLIAYVPTDMEVGLHELTLEGFDPAWEYTEQSVPVSVRTAKPWWRWIALGAGGAALLGALAVAWFGLGWRLTARIPRPRPPKQRRKGRSPAA
jgi:hypothetical protein